MKSVYQSSLGYDPHLWTGVKIGGGQSASSGLTRAYIAQDLCAFCKMALIPIPSNKGLVKFRKVSLPI